MRRRLRAAVETARTAKSARRERSDAAARAYEEFLAARAVPTFHSLAGALVAEGFGFRVFTPAGSVRLSSDRSADDYVELALDTTFDPPIVLGRSSRGRGRGAFTSERPVRERTAVADLTDEDVLDFLLDELIPFLER